jgi:hypothetical protein
MRPETHRVVPDPGKPPRSSRPARSHQHAARALDPPWVGWHVPEETPRRAEPGEGRRGPVARAEPSACCQPLDRQRPNGLSPRACPSVRIRRLNAIEVGSANRTKTGAAN